MPLAIETAREAFSHYATWLPYAQYDMKYEDMIKDRPLMATTVAGLAGLKTGPAVLENPLLFHPDSPRETDPTTLLHPLHLGDGRAEIWKNSDFPKKLNQQICSEFSTWMDECGYLV